MPLNENEQLLVEAIKSMLNHDAKLGLAAHDKTQYEPPESRSLGYLHEHINEMFMLKAADLTHADGICRAFNKVHSYKYLDDPNFSDAMSKEMISQAIPADERSKALEFIPKIIKELKDNLEEWSEKDEGFNKDLNEIQEISRPEQPLDFEIQDRGFKQNVKSKPGETKPGITPSNDD